VRIRRDLAPQRLGRALDLLGPDRHAGQFAHQFAGLLEVIAPLGN
jgi:hypothetical protein